MTNRVEVIDVDDVQYSQGIVEQLFRVGTIRVHSSDLSHPTLRMSGIDEVRQVAEAIDEARRQERIRRGLYVEAV